MVEHAAVNRVVVGSSPTSGAIKYWHAARGYPTSGRAHGGPTAEGEWFEKA
jgi:hypothetical protein